MNIDLKRIRSIIFRMHCIRFQQGVNGVMVNNKIHEELRYLNSRLHIHLSTCRPSYVASLETINTEDLDDDMSYLHELRISERFRFMLLERVYSQFDNVSGLIESIQSNVDNLRVSSPAERRARLEIVVGSNSDLMDLFNHTLLGSSSRKRLLNEFTRFLIQASMTHLGTPYSRLTFLVDDPEDTAAINSTIDSKLEVFNVNTEINSNIIRMAKDRIDVVTLFLSPHYLVFCDIISRMSIASPPSSIGDLFESRSLLEYAFANVRKIARSVKPASAITRVTMLTCVLFYLIITMDPIPSGLYLHFALARDFFPKDIDPDIIDVFGNLFWLIQRISPDPNADIVSFIDSS